MENVIKPLAKGVLIPLGLIVAAPAAKYIKKILGCGTNTTLILSNDDILKSLEDSGLLLKRVSETIQNEANEQKGGFLSMLLGELGASLLGNMGIGKIINRSGEGFIRAGYGSKRSLTKDFQYRLIL